MSETLAGILVGLGGWVAFGFLVTRFMKSRRAPRVLDATFDAVGGFLTFAIGLALTAAVVVGLGYLFGVGMAL